MTSTGSGKRPSTGDQLGIVDDADEAARRGGDDLLAGQCRAAALDETQLRIGLVGAVDVHVEVADRVQIQDFDAVLLQTRRGALRTRYGTPNAHFARSQRIDEEVHGGAGADAEDVVVGRRKRVPLRRRAASSIGAHVLCPSCGVRA